MSAALFVAPVLDLPHAVPRQVRRRRFISAGLLALSLVACGGGSTSATTSGSGGTGQTPVTTPVTPPVTPPIVGPSPDVTPPTVTAVSAVTLSAGQLTVRVDARDNVAVTAVCLRSDTSRPAATDACFHAGSTVTTPALLGTQAYRGYARDAAGNVSAAFEQALDAYALDTGLPVVTGVVQATLAGGKVRLTATATDDQGVSGYCFRSQGDAPAATDACFQAAASTEVDAPANVQAYQVYARDLAGHVSVARDILVDAVAPVVSAVTMVSNNASLVVLDVAAQDNQAVTGWCLRKAAAGNPAAPAPGDACFSDNARINLQTPVDAGVYQAHARDAAGNVSAPFAYTLDLITPSVIALTASAPVNGEVTLTARAVDSIGVTAYCLRLETEVGAPLASDACFKASNVTKIPLPATPSTVRAYARDAAGNVSMPYTRTLGACSAAGLTASNASSLQTVCVQTTKGEFVLELENVKAPISVANFLTYVAEDFYAQTLFHRVMADFMIQAGGYTMYGEKMVTHPPIVLERTSKTGLSNTVGTLAMARSSAADSGTSQFYINVVDNASKLNAGGSTGSDGYAVFGRVISGLDSTVQAIRNLSVTYNGGELSAPLEPPRILWAYRLK